MGENRVHIFTGHRNLLFVFATLAFQHALGKQVFSSVRRWAIFISRFNFIIELIDGDEMVFADVLTRWAIRYRFPELSTASYAPWYQLLMSKISHIKPRKSGQPRRKWKMLKKKQKQTRRGAVHGNDRIITVGDLMWIRVEDAELKMWIIVASHCGEHGQHWKESTRSTIKEDFLSPNLSDELGSVVSSCLCCRISRVGQLLLIPLTPALHKSFSNEDIHADYLYMGASAGTKLKYILIIRD